MLLANLRRLLADENAQATTEYVLFMAVLVPIVLSVGAALQRRMRGLLQNNLNKFGEELAKGSHKYMLRGVN